jgi:predicted amidophosphoribosyltransferase
MNLSDDCGTLHCSDPDRDPEGEDDVIYCPDCKEPVAQDDNCCPYCGNPEVGNA